MSFNSLIPLIWEILEISGILSSFLKEIDKISELS
jgi:hypothetical protein